LGFLKRMSSMQPGDPAPSVTLNLHTGEAIPLADLYRNRVVVLFFYPKDNTAICTREASAFRDSYEQFAAAGATVVGVSGDSADSHQRFADKHRLPFLLATDEDGSLRRAFSVPKTLGLFPGRTTYVIDRAGVIRHVFSAQFAADAHVQAALKAIHSLATSAAG
jgi:thioredoxin-dependent peroxiredoxin